MKPLRIVGALLASSALCLWLVVTPSNARAAVARAAAQPDADATQAYTADADNAAGAASAASANRATQAAKPCGGHCGTVFKITPSGTLTTLYYFCSKVSGRQCTDGQYASALIEAADGDFYATTYYGGRDNEGTTFRMTQSGALTTLHSFCGGISEPGCADGGNPQGPLRPAPAGGLYGSTTGGEGHGTVFAMAAGGALATLHRFCADGTYPTCVNGNDPSALESGAGGDFYGTDFAGGAHGAGTVFKVTALGAVTTLYSFCAVDPPQACADGAKPAGALLRATDGNLYGSTYAGGANGHGTIFRITPAGVLTTLFNFCPPDTTPACAGGDGFSSPLIEAADGALYGTAVNGGAGAWGTVFRLALDGTLTTLHSFCADGAFPDCPDGAGPVAALLEGSDGNLYGTTAYGGTDNQGTVFKLTRGGVLTTLHSFTASDGAFPSTTLIEARDGNFYGTTEGTQLGPDPLR